MARTAEVPLPSGTTPPAPAGDPGTEPIPGALDPDRVPAHVAWALGAADRAGRGPGFGAPLLEVVDGALALGVRWVTVYALSATDWDRFPGQLAGPVAALEAFLADGLEQLVRRGVRLRRAGRRDGRVPDALRARLASAEERTAAGDRLTLTLALDYDGRAEIVEAIAALAGEEVDPDKVDEAAIGRRLYHPDMPDPDLVVRTSGERRVSDLLLWEVAYSELVFVDAAWADVRRGDLYGAVLEYQRRDRRYGGLDPAAPERGGPR